MAIRPALFLLFFFFCLFMSVIKHPRYAIIGYMGVYLVGPENVWWRGMLPSGLRYSFFMGAALAASMLLFHRRKLILNGPFLLPLEKLLILYAIWGFISYYAYGETDARALQGLDKLAKLTIFLLMMSHFGTTLKEFRFLAWVLVSGGLLFGLRAFTAPASAFSKGRLDTLGGPDFVGSNPFALQMACCLVFVGVMFLIVHKPLVRAGLLMAGAFILNAIIMARGRGAFLGLGVGGLVAMSRAPKRARKAVYTAAVLAVIGFVVLGDQKYWDRITMVQSVEEAEQDESANSRIETWTAAMEMFQDHPMGVGRGKFARYIGQYNSKYTRRDAHNTFVRCMCEMGIIGITLFLAIFYKSFRALMAIRKRSADGTVWGKELALYAFGIMVALSIYLSGGFFSTVLNIEGFWWLVGMTVCLQRVVLNHEAAADILPQSSRPTVVPIRPSAHRGARAS